MNARRRWEGAAWILLSTLVASGVAAAGADGESALLVPAGRPAVVDGTLGQDEWADARTIHVSEALTLRVKHTGAVLYLGVKTRERCVANVLVATGNEVRILHSSAALGTATYRREAGTWNLAVDFNWKCRAVEATAAAIAERERFLRDEGWLADNVFTGAPDELEYELRWPGRDAALAVFVAPVLNPSAFASWPATAGQTALPGPIPSQARFDLATWGTLELEPESGTIAFSSVRQGNCDIYTISTDGLDLRRVTSAVAEESEPSWAPDASRIAYQSRRPAWGLYTSLLDGADERVLVATQSWSPAWSPDGSRIAYSTGSSIRCVAAASGNVEVLAPSCGDCGRPAWSPDAGELAFHASFDGGLDIYVLDLDDGTTRRLTTGPRRDLHASWSPDGEWIAFASERDGNLEIYTMRNDGTSVSRITHSPGDDMLPAWSPLGDWIAFTTNRDGNYEIYLVKPDGSGLRRLTDNPGDDMYPAWKP